MRPPSQHTPSFQSRLETFEIKYTGANLAPTGALRGINPLVYEPLANIHFCLLKGQAGGSSVVESADGSIGDGGVVADFVGWLNSCTTSWGSAL